ncbi:MAG: VCBS repeat-containing protein [Betaproteobacteria bacterium]|nr:VCBS repeat-containing protein [Betaproteobacteria bacterium]
MKISSYLALLLTNALIACGGGGGGSGASTSGANTSSNIIQATTFLGTKTSAGSFTYYRDGSISNPVSYIYAKDINNDGVDEVFFVAFETQPNTQANYSNTSIHIFGWENNVFKEITSTWLPGTSNQVEGVGDLVFGDFNGDGKIDCFYLLTPIWILT